MKAASNQKDVRKAGYDMPDSADAVPGTKINPSAHPIGIGVLIASALAFAVVTGLFFTGNLSLGDAIFGWIASTLTAISALGHVLDTDENPGRTTKGKDRKETK